uniref:Uncharacterized protein n=1 Tax=Biomphalaria glabrata TaxID=6526 RepID=A0A2C9LM50_BIOGL
MAEERLILILSSATPVICNIRQARDQTKRLEEESQKMEERLRELKTAMTREKEDREKKGGGFWGRGQQNVGSLTGYASEVLQSKSDKLPKDTKKKKIKVLQDEPLDVPKRSSQPGTMKNIAQRKLPTGITPRGDKLRGGPKCGQCEDRTATLVSCQIDFLCLTLLQEKITCNFNELFCHYNISFVTVLRTSP